MAFWRTNRDKDAEYCRNTIDKPPPANPDVVRASIMELRRVYKDRYKTDAEFAQWYAVRYGLRPEAVAAVLRGGNGNAHKKQAGPG